MEWWGILGVVLGSSVIVKLLDVWLARRKRKDDVADREETKADKLAALDAKVERYKIDTDKELLALRTDMNDMDERFQEVFTNLDNKLDDSLRHVAVGNELLRAMEVNGIAYRAKKLQDAKSVDGDEYRNLLREYICVKNLVGDPDDPDVLYLDGIMKKVESMKIT